VAASVASVSALVPWSARPGPFSLSDPAHLPRVLGQAGFVDVGVRGCRRPMCFGSDPAGAYDFVLGLLGWLLDGLDAAGRARARAALRASMASHATSEGVLFGSAAWIVTARRPR
jgi:hypothetical protein